MSSKTNEIAANALVAGVIGVVIVLIVAGLITASLQNDQPLQQNEQPRLQNTVACPNCNGTGLCKPPEFWIALHPEDDKEGTCSMCGGSGVLRQEPGGILRNITTPDYRDGSVLFWVDGILVKPILKHTGSHITHAAVILNGYVYEAVPPCVRKIPLADYIKEMEAKKLKPAMQRRGFTYFIMQPKTPYTQTEIAAMVKHAESQLGRPYMLRGWWKGHEVRGIFCSNLIADIVATSRRITSAGVHESPGSLYAKLQPLYTEQQ
jgi:hypothetical protein